MAKLVRPGNGGSPEPQIASHAAHCRSSLFPALLSAFRSPLLPPPSASAIKWFCVRARNALTTIMLMPQSHAEVTWSMIEEANHTLSFKEYMFMASDYGIVPNLLTVRPLRPGPSQTAPISPVPPAIPPGTLTETSAAD